MAAKAKAEATAAPPKSGVENKNKEDLAAIEEAGKEVVKE